MAKKKAKKTAAKTKEKEVPKKEEPKKKGLPIIPILIGAVIVIAVGGWFLLDSMLNDDFEEVDFGVPEVGIDVLEIPMVAAEGDQVTVTWRVLGTGVDSSELVYSVLPKGAFGNDFDASTLEVDGSGYEGTSEGQPGESDFEGEIFTTTITVDYVPVFMRIHAKSGETNYWTEEMVILGAEG